METLTEYCERLWSAWLQGWRPFESDRLQHTFDLDAAPEPYLLFGSVERPLTVLTTNPGQTMDHQRAESIELGNDVLTPVMNYEQVAKALGRYYTNNLSGAALQRVLAQQDLAEKSGYGGVMQVECCPWHSAKLPEKQRFIQTAQENDHLRTYVI